MDRRNAGNSNDSPSAAAPSFRRILVSFSALISTVLHEFVLRYTLPAALGGSGNGNGGGGANPSHLRRGTGQSSASSSKALVPGTNPRQSTPQLPPQSADDQGKVTQIPPPPPPPPPPGIPPPPPLPPLPPGGVPSHLQSNDANATNKKVHIRSAAGKVWSDPNLADWPENDYRLFVGNLPKDVTDQQLYEHFSKYPSLQMVKVILDTKGVSKGYGFVSLVDPMECARAIREMDQTWLSSRPIKVKRSDWKDRELKSVEQKKKQQRRKQNRSL